MRRARLKRSMKTPRFCMDTAWSAARRPPTVGSWTGNRDHCRSNPKITHRHCAPINCSCVVRCCMFIAGLRTSTNSAFVSVRSAPCSAATILSASGSPLTGPICTSAAGRITFTDNSRQVHLANCCFRLMSPCSMGRTSTTSGNTRSAVRRSRPSDQSF